MDPTPASHALADVTAEAAASAERSLPARLVTESARLGKARSDVVRDAAQGMGLLEAALRTHSALVDPGVVRDAEPGHAEPVPSGLAGAWLLGRASEVIARCGDDAAALWTQRTHALVRAEILEFEDLYDAERSPARYLAVAEMRTGGLLALAVRLGALLVEAEQPTPDALEQYGRQLGIAVEIRADVAALDGANGQRTGRPGPGSGRYTLPVLYALESDPELAGSLGTPFNTGELIAVIERVRSAKGLERAEREAVARVQAAGAALSEAVGNGLLAIRDEVTKRA